MATIEFDVDAAAHIPRPVHSLVDGGPAEPTVVRARSWGVPRGPEFRLPFGQREARRLRLTWLNTLAAVIAPILAVLAVIDFLQFLGAIGDDRFALSWSPLGTLIVLDAVAIVFTHVAQRPTVRRGNVVRIHAVDDRVAAEWASLAGDQVRIIRPGSR